MELQPHPGAGAPKRQLETILGVSEDMIHDLASLKFHQWLEPANGTPSAPSPPSFYWLVGMPGSGKTMLAASLISSLQSRSQIFVQPADKEDYRVLLTLLGLPASQSLSGVSGRALQSARGIGAIIHD